MLLLILRNGLLEPNSDCVTSQARRNISEKCQSAAVKSSTNVKVAVTECLSMESVLAVIIAGKSIHWKYIFWWFDVSTSFGI